MCCLRDSVCNSSTSLLNNWQPNHGYWLTNIWIKSLRIECAFALFNSNDRRSPDNDGKLVIHANYNGLMMDNMQTEAQPTRTRILNAAREIFSENGFHSASMKAICKSCAISPGTLYHHFISKEALIQAIILQDQERALARFREPIEGIHFVDYMVESIVSLTHEAFGQRALVVEIMAEGMRNPQVAAMLKNKHMTITEFVAQRMRDAQQKGEISPDINTAMTSRLLLDLTYGVLADIEAEDLAREASFAQGLRAMIGGILTAS